MFETKGKYDKKLLMEAYFSTIRIPAIAAVALVSVFCLVFFVYYLVTALNYSAYYGEGLFFGWKYLLSAGLYLLLGALYNILLYVVMPRRFANLTIKRNAVQHGAYDVETIVSFDEEGAVIANSANENKSVIKYEYMTRLKKGKKAYYISTSARMFFPVFVDQLSEDDKAALIAFLKEKTNIKNLK